MHAKDLWPHVSYLHIAVTWHEASLLNTSDLLCFLVAFVCILFPLLSPQFPMLTCSDF